MVTALDTQTALVLIDFQRGIVEFPLVNPVQPVVANARRLLAAFRQARLPVVLVTVDPTKGITTLRSDAPQLKFGVLPAEWLTLVPDLQPEPTDILVTKHTWGAFQATRLDEELRRRQVTGLVLAGISTSIGVESTARAAHERGYNLTFAQDAMTDTDAGAQRNSLDTIFRRIGEVDTTAAILRALPGAADQVY